MKTIFLSFYFFLSKCLLFFLTHAGPSFRDDTDFIPCIESLHLGSYIIVGMV